MQAQGSPPRAFRVLPGSKLLDQSGTIVVPPDIRDLAAAEAIDCDRPHRHLPAGRCDSHELARMRAAERPTYRYPVFVGNQIFDRDPIIRKSAFPASPQPDGPSLELLEPSDRGNREIVVDVVGSEDFVDYPLVPGAALPELLDDAVNDVTIVAGSQCRPSSGVPTRPGM